MFRDRDTEGDRQALAKALMALFWTSGYIVGALATAHTPALTVSFWRLLVATPLMAAIALSAKARWPRGAEFRWVVLAGLLLQAVQFSGVYTALQVGAPAGLVALLAGTSPVLVAIGGSLFFDERLDRRQWVGSAIGVLGVVFAVADEMGGSLTVGGLLLALLGVGGLASGTLVQRHRVGAVDPRSANTIQLAASAVFMAVVAGIGPGFSVPLTYAALAPIAWLTLGLSICAILLFFWLLRRQKGGEATSFLYVVPALTAIAAVPVLGQSLKPGVIAGLALSLIGVYMVGGGRARRDEAEATGGRPARAERRFAA